MFLPSVLHVLCLLLNSCSPLLSAVFFACCWIPIPSSCPLCSLLVEFLFPPPVCCVLCLLNSFYPALDLCLLCLLEGRSREVPSDGSFAETAQSSKVDSSLMLLHPVLILEFGWRYRWEVFAGSRAGRLRIGLPHLGILCLGPRLVRSFSVGTCCRWSPHSECGESLPSVMWPLGSDQGYGVTSGISVLVGRDTEPPLYLEKVEWEGGCKLGGGTSPRPHLLARGSWPSSCRSVGMCASGQSKTRYCHLSLC